MTKAQTDRFGRLVSRRRLPAERTLRTSNGGEGALLQLALNVPDHSAAMPKSSSQARPTTVGLGRSKKWGPNFRGLNALGTSWDPKGTSLGPPLDPLFELFVRQDHSRNLLSYKALQRNIGAITCRGSHSAHLPTSVPGQSGGSDAPASRSWGACSATPGSQPGAIAPRAMRNPPSSLERAFASPIMPPLGTGPCRVILNRSNRYVSN